MEDTGEVIIDLGVEFLGVAHKEVKVRQEDASKLLSWRR